MNLTAAGPAVSSRYRLRLLGRFELTRGPSPLRVSPASERLLAYLAIRSDPASRQQAAEALWPDCTDIRAAGNLRSALWRLPGREQDRLVTSRSGRIALAPQVAVDLQELSGRLTGPVPAEEAGPHGSIPVLRQDVLPGWPEDWLVAPREWYRQIRLRALESLCDQHRAAGRLDTALRAGLAAVASDPLRESAHRGLARVHIDEGNYAEALRQYHTYRELSRAELGLPPSPQFRELIAPLLGRPLDRQLAGQGYARPA
jgi:DNA-binding SARP family transcriptional activator